MRKLASFMGLMLLILTTSIFTSCKEPIPEPKVYTVTFDAAGGSEVAAIQVKSGEKAVQPEDPTKEGYVFDAWYNGEAVYDWETPVTADITLKAKWTDKTYTVTFVGVEGIDAQEIKHKDKVTKPEDPKKDGYTFGGWYNGETAYDFESLVTSDLELKAKWDVVKYSITFEVEGVEKIVVETGKTAEKPADPTKEGYTFAGWLNGEEAYDWTKPVTADVVLKASWEVIEYKINYVLPEGVTTDNPATYTIETEVITLKDAKVPEGKYFGGWFIDKEYKTAATSIEKGSTGDKTFYAKLNDNPTFTLTLKDGEKEYLSLKVEEGKVATKPEADPTKVGYTFNGWMNGETAYDWKSEVTADLTLIASWDINKYTVTIDGVSQTVEYGTVLKEPAKPADVAGKEFKGWYNGGKAYDWTKPVTSNLSLTQKWDVVKYKITFDVDGGSEVKPFEVDYETVANEPAAPTKEGHLFAGWFVGEVAYDWSAKVKENLTLKAKWNKALAGIFEFDTEYNGWQEWSMIENKNSAGTATIADPSYLNVNVKDKGLKEKDTIKVEVKFASTEGLKQIGVQSACDGYTWHNINLNETNTYEVEFKIGANPTFANDLFGFWFTPQDGDGALIGKKYSLYYESIKITHIPYVPVEGEEDVGSALETTFNFDKEYSGSLEWDMVANGEWGNSTTKESIYLNVNVKDVELKKGDKIVVDFKLTSTEGLQYIGYQSAVDPSSWAAVTTTENNTYKVSWTIGDKTTFDNNLFGFWFTPQGVDASLVGKKCKLNFESLKVTLIPYVPGTFDGNVDLTKLTGYNETEAGIVKDFESIVENYETVAEFILSDLGYNGETFSKIAVIADVYDADGNKYDITSNWNARLVLAINDTDVNYNGGDENQSADFSAASDKLTVKVKAVPVTKVVITKIVFI